MRELFADAQQQHRNIHLVAYFVRGGPMQNIANETMAVRAHCDQIDLLVAGQFDDFIRRFPQGENGIAGKTFFDQLPAALFQIGAVLFHLFALSQLQLIEISGHPSIRDMDEKQLRPRHAGKRLDVAQDRFVGGSVFQGNQNVMIHDGGKYYVGGAKWRNW